MFFVELCFEIFLSADEEKLQLWQRDRNPLRQRQRRDHQDQVQLSHCPPGEGEDAAEPGSEEVRIATCQPGLARCYCRIRVWERRPVII